MTETDDRDGQRQIEMDRDNRKLDWEQGCLDWPESQREGAVLWLHVSNLEMSPIRSKGDQSKKSEKIKQLSNYCCFSKTPPSRHFSSKELASEALPPSGTRHNSIPSPRAWLTIRFHDPSWRGWLVRSLPQRTGSTEIQTQIAGFRVKRVNITPWELVL